MKPHIQTQQVRIQLLNELTNPQTRYMVCSDLTTSTSLSSHALLTRTYIIWLQGKFCRISVKLLTNKKNHSLHITIRIFRQFPKVDNHLRKHVPLLSTSQSAYSKKSSSDQLVTLYRWQFPDMIIRPTTRTGLAMAMTLT